MHTTAFDEPNRNIILLHTVVELPPSINREQDPSPVPFLREVSPENEQKPLERKCMFNSIPIRDTKELTEAIIDSWWEVGEPSLVGTWTLNQTTLQLAQPGLQ